MSSSFLPLPGGTLCYLHLISQAIPPYDTNLTSSLLDYPALRTSQAPITGHPPVDVSRLAYERGPSPMPHADDFAKPRRTSTKRLRSETILSTQQGGEDIPTHGHFCTTTDVHASFPCSREIKKNAIFIRCQPPTPSVTAEHAFHDTHT